MAENNSSKLPRTVGLYGLMFVSLGSIIGSGWLLGAISLLLTWANCGIYGRMGGLAASRVCRAD